PRIRGLGVVTAAEGQSGQRRDHHARAHLRQLAMWRIPGVGIVAPMALSVGIVGLPNVGKSTVFNALTAGKAEAANYPFCTIDPNVGIVAVPDPRMARITKYIPPQKVIPTIVEIVDIAGLVKGASKGEGLGNKFLANIRETSAILLMVRCFADPNVIHVAGSVDPMRDIDIIELELVLADMDTAEKRVKKASGSARTGNKDA